MRFILLALLLAPLLVRADSPQFTSQLSNDEIRAAVDSHTRKAIDLYREFLSLPNDANHPDDILRLIEWMEPQFRARGFSPMRIPTDGSPFLLAERLNPDSDRTVLVYLQADGQPVDPSAWYQDSPWEAVLKEQDAAGNWNIIDWSRLDKELNPDWRIFARSASDSKGPMAQFLIAMDVLRSQKVEPDFNLVVIIDTEEELGSPNLADALADNRERLDAELLLIFDGPPHASNEPTVSFGARGIATATLTVYGPKAPQHSGHYGNFVPNPAMRLAQLLATMKDADGRVTIDGFYDGVTIDSETRSVLASVPDDEEKILADMGVASPDKVAESLQEAIQYPSLNIRGMRSAWVGNESRTIIPSSAVAEIDVRLVKESDADRLLDLIARHVEAQGYTLLDQAPTNEQRLASARIASMTSEVSYGAFRSDYDAIAGQLARSGMRGLYGEEPILIRTMGGSIPIAPIVDLLDIPAATVPTVNMDNNQHSPNENLRLGNFIEGIAILTSVLSQQAAPEQP